MAEFPIFPLDTSKLLSDTLHMTTEEFGAYVLILLAMWREGGRLRTSDLRNISKLSAHKFEKYSERILRPLTIIDGTVSQKRLEDTRLKIRAIRAKRAKAAGARWKGSKACMCIAHASSVHMQTACKPDAIKRSKKERKKKGAADKASEASFALTENIHRRGEFKP